VEPVGFAVYLERSGNVKQALFLSVACAVSLLIAGCGGGPAEQMNAMTRTIREMTDTLKTITDEQSAKAAAPKLDELAKKLPAQQKSFKEARGKLDPEEAKRVAREFLEAMGALGQEMQRVNTDVPQAREVVKKVQEAMAGVSPE
jgi:methyl-accepting chemotaxis protein